MNDLKTIYSGNLRTITSNRNDEIKEITKLETVDGREAQGRFIAEGLRVCTTLAQAGCKPVQVYVTSEDRAQELKGIVHRNKITIVSKHVMERISQVTTPSGILGIFPIPKKPSIRKLGPGLVLARIVDPGNLGTLLRTAAAMNKKSVVLISTVDPYGPKVIQASAGCIAHLDIFKLEWEKLVNAKNKRNLKLAGLVVKGGKKPSSIDFKDTLLVVGNEASGIPEPWLRNCDEQVTLPMPGKTESLNAAIAGAIALYLACQHETL
jgi:TrmH family RNA methyltransferase